MEFVQFHPTGMVWPPSVRGSWSPSRCAATAASCKNSDGKRFMFDYIPEFFKAETADTEEEADRWYDDKKNNRRPPELLPRDEVARAINSEIKAGRGSEHGGIFLDIASRRSPDFIRKRLPSMYHQFKELADVDITEEPMEIGPTCHYVMGGVEVDADTEQAHVPGLYAAGECSGGMHGSNRLGGNSLSDLLVFGRRAGEAAAAYVAGLDARPVVSEDDVRAGQWSALAPFDAEGGDNPYTIQQDLQQTMNDLVGIIRTEAELKAALTAIEELKQRAADDEHRGAPAVQPRLAPGPRPAQHAAGRGVDRQGGPRAPGVPRRPHPRRLPEAGRRVGHQEPRRDAGRRPRVGDAEPAAVAPDARRPAEVLRVSERY